MNLAAKIRRFVLLNPALAGALILCLVLALRGFHPQAAPRLDLDRTVEVEGWLVRSPLWRAASVELEVAPLKVLQDGVQVEYPDRIQVLVRRNPEDGPAPVGLSFGDRVRLRAFLSEPPYSAIPGVADYRRILLLRGIRHQILLKSARQVEVLGVHPPVSFVQPLFRYVEGFEDYCRSRFSRRRGSLLLGVSLGRRPAWEGRERHQVERLGIVHLFVVSGFHVSLLVLLLHRLLRRLGMAGTLLSLAGMWLYVLLTGAGVPTVRAALMTSLFYLLMISGLQRRMLNALGASALAVLTWQPQSLFSAGFQFSYLALLAIGWAVLPNLGRMAAFSRAFGDVGSPSILLQRQGSEVLRRRVRFALEERLAFAPGACLAALRFCGRLLGFALPLVLTSLAIQLATLPLALHYSNLWLWTQGAANLLMAPLFSLLVPAGLILLLVYRTPLAFLASALLDLYLRMVESALDGFEGWTAADFLPQPHLWEALLYFALLLAVAAFLRGRLRLCCLPLPALILRLLLARTPAPDGRLQLTMLDVGQGEALHLAYPDGAQALVDAGGRFGPAGLEDDFVGRRLAARYLWEERVKRLGFVLLSHPHSDHVQGFGFVRRVFGLGRVYYFDPPPFELGSGRAGRLAGGDRFWAGGVLHEVLHPPRRGSDFLSVNDRSLVVLLRYGDFSLLLSGDIEAPSERRLLPGLGAVTALKVPHHGGKTSSTRAFLERLAADVALISAGRRNPFGHPSGEVLKRLKQTGIPAFSTVRWGSLRLETDGRRWQLSHYSIERQEFVELAAGSAKRGKKISRKDAKPRGKEGKEAGDRRQEAGRD